MHQNIISLPFVYLITTILGICMSLCFYVWGNKKLRKHMIIAGLYAASFSVVTGYLWWTKDWWQPQTITGTIVGIEDFLLGLAVGEIFVVVYDRLFYTRVNPRAKDNFLTLYIIGSTLFILMSICFYVLHLTTFVSSIITFGLMTFGLLIPRPYLILRTIGFGLCITIAFTLVYFFIQWINPDWIQATYLWWYLSGIRVFNVVPIEEIVFWFVFATTFAPMYEYCRSTKNI